MRNKYIQTIGRYKKRPIKILTNCKQLTAGFKKRKVYIILRWE